MVTHVLVVISADTSVSRSLSDLLRASGLGEPRVSDSTLAFVEQYDPTWCGCLLLDLRIPAFDALRLLKHQQGVPCRMGLVYFTARDGVPMGVDGAKGEYHLRVFSGDDPAADLLGRVRGALHENEITCARAAERATMRTRFEGTSKRERQVLEHLARGHTNKEIAADLAVSPRTVEIYRSRLQQKLHADSAADLVRFWMTLQLANSR